MNDSMLLMTGIGVFSLMVIGMVLTVIEFRSIAKRKSRKSQDTDFSQH